MAAEKVALPPGLHVLLVEDEPLIAIDGEAMLLTLGADSVVTAHSVSQALQAVDGQSFHAAILDLRLGNDTSLVLAARLQELGVPFGFLTGYAGDVLPEHLKDCPIVRKPFAVDDLSRLLRTLLAPRT